MTRRRYPDVISTIEVLIVIFCIANTKKQSQLSKRVESRRSVAAVLETKRSNPQKHQEGTILFIPQPRKRISWHNTSIMPVAQQGLSRATARNTIIRLGYVRMILGLVALFLFGANVIKRGNNGQGYRQQSTEKDSKSPHRLSTTMDSVDPFTLAQHEWYRWVANQTIAKSYLPKAGPNRTLSCGLSLKMRMESKELVFFKAAFAVNIDHKSAESHLREIKAAYLDRILGTGVVLPATGVIIDRRVIINAFPENQRKEYRSKFRENLLCEPAAGNWSGAASSGLRGSMMYYLQGVNKTRGENIITAATTYRNTIEHTSAVNYAVFLYLAGCTKTPHNHFQIDSKRFVSLDNDRCFTPVHVIQGPNVPQDWYDLFGVWEQLVFEICKFPDSLLETLRSANNTKVKLSQQLQVVLSEDDLSDDLLSEQPEAFQEIDVRAERLFRHMESEHCQVLRRLVPLARVVRNI